MKHLSVLFSVCIAFFLLNACKSTQSSNSASLNSNTPSTQPPSSTMSLTQVTSVSPGNNAILGTVESVEKTGSGGLNITVLVAGSKQGSGSKIVAEGSKLSCGVSATMFSRYEKEGKSLESYFSEGKTVLFEASDHQGMDNAKEKWNVVKVY